MKKTPINRKRIANYSFPYANFLFVFLLILTGCNNHEEENSDGYENSDVKEIKTDMIPLVPDTIPLVMSDEYSKMKDGKKIYQIKNDDSLIVDIGRYEFILPDPAFRYIRENIDYHKMLGGSWAYIDILYNDSLEMRGTLVEIEKDSVFYIEDVMNKLNEKNIKEFDIRFRFYIDNGKGQQEIDHFPVLIIN